MTTLPLIILVYTRAFSFKFLGGLPAVYAFGLGAAFHRGDTTRTFLGTPVVHIYGRMRHATAGELHEGNRLMYPRSVVEILLMGIMQDCQKKNGAKDCRTTHTHRDYAEAKM